MKRRSALTRALLSLVAACGVAITGAAMTGTAASAYTVTGRWGTVKQVPGIGALDVGHNSGLDVLSCSAPGDCAGGGHFTDGSNDTMSFVVDEQNGTWGPARPIPGLAALNTSGNAAILSLSCASPGNCAAGGYVEVATLPFKHGSPMRPTEFWGQAREVPGVAALGIRLGQLAVLHIAWQLRGGRHVRVLGPVGRNRRVGGTRRQREGRHLGHAADGVDPPGLDAGKPGVLSDVSCSTPVNCADKSGKQQAVVVRWCGGAAVRAIAGQPRTPASAGAHSRRPGHRRCAKSPALRANRAGVAGWLTVCVYLAPAGDAPIAGLRHPGRAASHGARGMPSGISAFIRISGARRRRPHPGHPMIMGQRGPYSVPVTHDHGHRPCQIPRRGIFRLPGAGLAREAASAASPERARQSAIPGNWFTPAARQRGLLTSRYLT